MNMNTAYNQGYIDGMTKVAMSDPDLFATLHEYNRSSVSTLFPDYFQVNESQRRAYDSKFNGIIQQRVDDLYANPETNAFLLANKGKKYDPLAYFASLDKKDRNLAIKSLYL